MFDGHKPGRELDDTAASAANDRFEEILRRIKTYGGEITKDETVPLIIDWNNDTAEIGERRVVEFNIKKTKTDFQIIRDVKNFRAAGGDGHRKHLEAIDRPMIETKLKSKPETSDQWVGMDFEDMF